MLIDLISEGFSIVSTSVNQSNISYIHILIIILKNIILLHCYFLKKPLTR